MLDSGSLLLRIPWTTWRHLQRGMCSVRLKTGEVILVFDAYILSTKDMACQR